MRYDQWLEDGPVDAITDAERDADDHCEVCGVSPERHDADSGSQGDDHDFVLCSGDTAADHGFNDDHDDGPNPDDERDEQLDRDMDYDHDDQRDGDYYSEEN